MTPARVAAEVEGIDVCQLSLLARQKGLSPNQVGRHPFSEI